MRDAADLAADEINATGVLGGSLQLLHRDSQTNPAAAVDAATELVFGEGVPVIIGAAASAVSQPVAEGVTVPNEVVQISPSSTSPFFSTFEAEEPGWFWRTAATDALQGKAAGLYAFNDKGWRNVAILARADPYGSGLAQAFQDTFEFLSGTITVRVDYNPDATSFTTELTTIFNSNPEAIWWVAYPGEGRIIMDEWWANPAWRGPAWLWSEGTKSQAFVDTLVAAGIDVTGVEGTAPILRTGPNYQTFRTAFLARYGEEPMIFTAHTYDALYLTALAAAAGQGVDSVSIRDSLIAVANPPGAVVGPGPQEFERAVGILEAGGDINYEGASGLVNFDPVGDVGGSYEIWQVTPTYDIVQLDVFPEEVMWPGLRIIGPWFGSERDAFLPVLDAFEVATGILTEYIPLRPENLRPILDEGFALGEAPADVIFMSPSYIQQASRDGHIVHVNHLIDEADFRAGTLDGVRVGSTYYGGAYTGKVKPGFWYRHSFFSAHGLTVPSTYAEFVALLGDMAAIPGIVNPIVSGDGVGWPLSDVTEHFLATYGGAQMHRDLTAGTLSWTDPSVKNVFSTYLIPLLEAGYFSTPLEWNTAALDGWWNGQYGLYFMGSWITGMVADPNDLGVFALPPEAGLEQGIVFFTDYIFIPAYTGVLGNAKLLFQFLASPEGQTIQVQQGGHIANALGVSLADYPAVDRQMAALLEGREILPDLDDVIGGEFQTTFWSQLQLLWAYPTMLDAVLKSLQSVAPIPTPSANTPPAASFRVSPSAGDLTTTFTADASLSSDAEDTSGALEVRWDWKDDGVWDTPWSTTKAAQHQYTEPGTYTIRLEVSDTGGLTNTTTRQVAVVVDKTPPVTTAVQSGTAGQAGWFVSWVVVTLLAVDDLSGVASTSFRIDGGASQAYTSPFTVGDGIHTVDYFSADHAGNTESVNSFDVRVDAVAPETSFSFDGTLGENGWYVSTVSVTLIAADATSGVSSIAYRIDGGAWQAYADPFTVEEGEHTLEYQAADAAGNEETINSAPLKVDTSKPTVAIDTPADGSILDSTSVSVSGTASDGFAVDRVELSADGTDWVRATGTTSWSGPLTLLEGSNTIFARATDTAGNTAIATITVMVETTPETPPPTEPETPPPGLQVSPSVATFAAIGAVAAAVAVAALLFRRRRAGGKGKG